MAYSVLFWDVDNTLLDFPYSQEYALKTCLSEIGVTADASMVERYSAINDDWWKRLERAEVSKKELLTGRFTDFFAEYRITCPDLPLFLSHYQEYLGSVYRYIDDSLALCRRLKGKCRQYAVTNGVAKTQRNKLQLAGFGEVLDDIFISEEIGSNKPSAAFFEEVFKRLPDVKKEEVLLIGDSLTSDILGGNNAGIATCYFNPGRSKVQTALRVDYEIASLWDVLQIVEA